ncbi:MAG TPA: hypothetical protein VEG30_04695 [Terriglobales bacterium]|nr:hypothetical protein [Terriglobales bacterium]
MGADPSNLPGDVVFPASTLAGFVQPALLALEQFIELANQFQESMVILLTLNLRAQLVHAFDFFRFHRWWDGVNWPKVFTGKRVFSCAVRPRGKKIGMQKMSEGLKSRQLDDVRGCERFA